MPSGNDLLDGNGSEADFLNAFGSSYEDNQTAYDAIDNGQVTSTDTTTTVNSPGWASSLSSLFGLVQTGGNMYSQLTGSTTAPAATVAQPAAGVAVPAKSGMSAMMWGALGLALVVVAFLFLKRR